MVFSYKNKFIIFYILVKIFSLTFHQNPVWERCICIQNSGRNGTNSIRSTRVCNEPNLRYEIRNVTSCCTSNMRIVESTEFRFHNAHHHHQL